MGIHVIKMPDIGEGIAEVELAAWNVKPGDVVKEDQSLADVMTDKATVEIPSPVSGTVLALGGAVGDVLAVGSELIRIEVDGAGNLATGSARAPVAEVAPVTPVAPAPASAAAQHGSALATQSATPAPGAARAGRGDDARRPARRPGERPIASPAVRRRAWDLGIELQFVAGSGTAGRITHEDLDDYLARGPADTGATPSADARYLRREQEEARPVIGLRRKIAQKMQDAKRRIPHFTYVEELDLTEVDGLRQQLNKKWGEQRPRLTLLPFLMRAVVLAVRDFPQVNARFDDEAGIVTRYQAVHLGIATQTDAGLMVPVVRHAETRDLWSSAAELSRLAAAARAGKALRDELSGSTITISSLGPLGGIVSTPVINHPEVAIIGVNRLQERAVVRGGTIVARRMMNLSSSFDHRVVDGQDAAEFIQAVRALLEHPATLFVE